MRDGSLARIPRRLHLIGIGGAGMSGLAHCLLELNREVSGSDLRRSAETERLAALGARICHDSDVETIAGAEAVVVSDAIPAAHPALRAALDRGISILRRAQCLDLVCSTRQAVMVAGSHGKSTTAAMIAKILEGAGRAPGFAIGADIPCLGGRRAHIGGGDHFVAEACEAFKNLDHLRPALAVITNIDDEHLEHHGTQAKLDAAFRDFASRASIGAVAHGDDAGVRRILAGIKAPVTSFGFDRRNDIYVSAFEFDARGSRFDIRMGEGIAGRIEMPIPGRHAILNALAAAAACRRLGLPFEAIARGLADFTGVARRWEDHGLVAGTRIIDDYAHHPAELAASIATAKAILAPDQRLVVVFQPQLHSRTRRLCHGFADALSGLDQLFLLEVDPGGERGPTASSSRLILDAMGGRGGAVALCGDVDELLDRAPAYLRRGDLVLIAGAGNIRTAAGRLRRRLEAGESAELPSPVAAPDLSGTILDLFRAQVAARPTACAIVQSEIRVSYGELDALAGEVARALLAREIGRGTVVSVSLPPSIDLIAILLALAEIGAVYLPIDESSPSERVRFLLAKAGAKLLIAAPGSPLDSALTKIETMDPAALRAGGPLPGGRRQASGPGADDTAYICFTSGSAGFPKGVAVGHRSLLGLIADIVPRFDIGGEARMALNTSIGFDVSLAEIWAPLCGGGTLVVTGARKPLIGEGLARFIVAQAVTHLAATPSVLASLPRRPLPALRCIIAAGEACPQALVEQWAPGRRFFNAYGPTEATVYATTAECHAGREVTIGKALGHIKAHVLDGELKLLGPGEVGELCLGGIGLAMGYVDAETGENRRFRVISIDGRNADRIYRTGDLVRYDAAGELSFLGRIDNQIKIRGNRLELEEIEQSIKRILGLDAAVCLRESAGSKELVCFLATGSPGSLARNTIADQLAGWLPAYMIPAHFIAVDEIPLTLSGKKDRRLLLARHLGRLRRGGDPVAPRSKLEGRLAALWTDVLEIDVGIGIHDDFTDLGGDSLKSLLLIEELELRLGISVPPGYFDGFTTVARMATQLGDLLRAGRAGAEPGSAFLDPRVYRKLRNLTAGWGGTRVGETALIVSAGGGRPDHHLFWCLQEEQELRALARHLGPEIAVHGMRSGHLVMGYSPPNLDAMARHYAEELRVLQPLGPILIGGNCQGATVAHAVATVLQEDGREIALLIMMDQTKLLPFDGDLAFIYGQESFLNPDKRYPRDVARYDEVYGARYSLDFITGGHGRYFHEPNARYLASRLRMRIATKLGARAG
jgi:UDP-N-acetylmuramate--L-alanine ligase